MISTSSRGSFNNTRRFLQAMTRLDIAKILETYGKVGVDALESATPIDSGLAANSWTYRVEKTGSGYSLSWHNTDVESGFPVAIMLQYGYGTGTGGYVQGRDYINPAIKPIFDKIEIEVWKAVTSA